VTDSGVPEAWPALLSREQLRAYLGGICDDTLRKVCPVAAVDLGANVLRYRKGDVDAWLAGLKARGLKPPAPGDDDGGSPAPANDRQTAALERMRARLGKR
jgi:hypothetical protein